MLKFYAAPFVQATNALANIHRDTLVRIETRGSDSMLLTQSKLEEQFRNFKDAWRNNVSHTRTVYQAGQTKDIMDNTRQFMQHLAERLKESGK